IRQHDQERSEVLESELLQAIHEKFVFGVIVEMRVQAEVDDEQAQPEQQLAMPRRARRRAPRAAPVQPRRKREHHDRGGRGFPGNPPAQEVEKLIQGIIHRTPTAARRDAAISHHITTGPRSPALRPALPAASSIRNPGTASISSGRAYRKPCSRSQPNSRSICICSPVSTPSATTCRPRLRPSAMIERTIARSPDSVIRLRTKARSILIWLTVRFFSDSRLE